MSETQTESETGAAPYRTPWTIHSVGRKDGALTVCTGDGGPAFGVAYVPNENDELTEEQQRLHARLIAAAGTAAQEAKEMGYDPVAAVEALPDLLMALQDIDGMIERLKYGTIRMMVNDALASAEGSGE